jgi:hypothetical protein
MDRSLYRAIFWTDVSRQDQVWSFCMKLTTISTTGWSWNAVALKTSFWVWLNMPLMDGGVGLGQPLVVVPVVVLVDNVVVAGKVSEMG